MNQDIQKSHPQTLHDQCYVSYYSQYQNKDNTIKKDKIQQAELTVRNLGSLCDRQFNNFSKYHQKQKFGFLTKLQTIQQTIQPQISDIHHKERLTNFLNIQLENTNQFLIKKEGKICGYPSYIFFQTMKILLQFEDHQENIQIPIKNLQFLNQFTQQKQRDIICQSLKLCYLSGQDIETYFQTVSNQIVDQHQHTKSENIILNHFQINDQEQCKLTIIFPYIFFSCINLNYDNDVHLSTHDVVKIIDLNFENLEYFLNEFYADKQLDIKNIQKIQKKNIQVQDSFITYNNCKISIAQKTQNQSSAEKSDISLLKFLKKSIVTQDQKIYQITFFPTQLTYIPLQAGQREIKCNLSMKNFIQLIKYSEEYHIIDQFSQEIMNFHTTLTEQMKNDNFDIKKSSLNVNQSQESDTKSNLFGIKQGKFSKDKLILDMQFLGNIEYDQNKLQQIEDKHISNAILESYLKEFEIDFQKFKMDVRAPRFEISNMGKDKIEIPCTADILNQIIQYKFQFDVKIEI